MKTPRLLPLLLVLLTAAHHTRAATTIEVTDEVRQAGVKRFGIGLAQHNYYDSAQMMKELLFRNPGFEGLLFQSVVRLGPGGTATSAIEDQPLTQWPSGFWAGAQYEIIWGAAKGRAGVVTNSLAPNRANPPNDPNGSTQGTTYLFDQSGPVPGNGDYIVLRKTHEGGTGGGAATASWQVSASGGGTVTSEAGDLPPRPADYPAVLPWSRQCARLTALTAGQQASVTGQFDTLQGFLRLNGAFRVAFKARGVGGANQLLVTVRRGTLAPYVSQTVQLTGNWTNYSLPFTAAEPDTISGAVSVSFSPVNQSAALLDDVSLRQTDSDPANPTEFRDDVVNALRGLRPGILRYVNWQDVGNSLDNALAPVFARKRSAYNVYTTTENNMMPGLHEFFVLCEHLGSDPWYSIPVPCSTQEVANLMEYLGGSTNTPYGAIRAALGHPAPWTGVFARIHLEFGNENWNNTAYRGAAISQPVPCGERASELFAVIKNSPYYNAAQFNCLLGGQVAVTGNNLALHNASALHDTFNLAPYMSSRVDHFATDEELFGSLFAEPEWWSFNPGPMSGFMRVNFNNLQASSRPVPLSIYEVNLHTTQGSISQSALDGYTPSVGAALAVGAHMLVMLKELGARDQLFFSLAGHRANWTATDGTARSSALWGSVLDMGKTNRKRPHYHMVQLLNEALGGDLLRTSHTGDDPTWNVTNLNRITYTGAHYIQSHAFRHGALRSLIVFNLHRTAALDVTFTGPHAPAGAVTLKRLTSANITDHNETADVVTHTMQQLADFNPAAPLSLPPFSMTLLQWHADLALNIRQETPAVVLEWQAIPRRPYQLEHSSNLTQWFSLGDPPLSTPTDLLRFADDGARTGAPPLEQLRRFYRVLIPAP